MSAAYELLREAYLKRLPHQFALQVTPLTAYAAGEMGRRSRLSLQDSALYHLVLQNRPEDAQSGKDAA